MSRKVDKVKKKKKKGLEEKILGAKDWRQEGKGREGERREGRRGGREEGREGRC